MLAGAKLLGGGALVARATGRARAGGVRGHESTIGPRKELGVPWCMGAAFPRALGDPSWIHQPKWEAMGWKTVAEAWVSDPGPGYSR